jgi:hypothetical protein
MALWPGQGIAPANEIVPRTSFGCPLRRSWGAPAGGRAEPSSQRVDEQRRRRGQCSRLLPRRGRWGKLGEPRFHVRARRGARRRPGDRAGRSGPSTRFHRPERRAALEGSAGWAGGGGLRGGLPAGGRARDDGRTGSPATPPAGPPPDHGSPRGRLPRPRAQRPGPCPGARRHVPPPNRRRNGKSPARSRRLDRISHRQQHGIGRLRNGFAGRPRAWDDERTGHLDNADTWNDDDIHDDDHHHDHDDDHHHCAPLVHQAGLVR